MKHPSLKHACRCGAMRPAVVAPSCEEDGAGPGASSRTVLLGPREAKGASEEGDEGA